MLAGNLASSGVDRPSPSTGIRPLAFLRAMACVDRSLRPITGGRCANFRPVPADAFGHHPYKFFGSPRVRSRKGDDAAIGDGRRLLRLLDRLQARGRIVKPTRGRFSVFYTEFGYQTDPPDPFAGISLRSHNRFLQEAAYLVWRTPACAPSTSSASPTGRCAGPAACAATPSSRAGFCSPTGARSRATAPSPIPFVIDGSRFWGQVRPGGAPHGRAPVPPQPRPLPDDRRARTDRAGYFRVRLRRRKGQYRYTYRGPSGASDTLRIR